jgi:hypothetical protein
MAFFPLVVQIFAKVVDGVFDLFSIEKNGDSGYLFAFSAPLSNEIIVEIIEHKSITLGSFARRHIFLIQYARLHQSLAANNPWNWVVFEL